MICLDANVFVSAATPGEVFHDESRRFLHAVQEKGISVLAPSLVLPEVAGAVARRSSVENGLVLLDLVHRYPGLSIVPLDEELAIRAAELAARFRLRGADASYVAVAEQRGVPLVTWDDEVVRRVADAIPVLTPDTWFAQAS